MVNMVEIETAFMVKMGIMVEIIIKVEMVTLVNIIKKVNMVVIVIMVKMVIVDVVTVGRSKYGIKLPPYCPILLRILTFPDPLCRPSQILWFKMVCTCVPHIVLHVLSSTSTSVGYFRPQKSILAKIVIFGCFLGLFTPPLGCYFGDIETCNA